MLAVWEVAVYVNTGARRHSLPRKIRCRGNHEDVPLGQAYPRLNWPPSNIQIHDFELTTFL